MFLDNANDPKLPPRPSETLLRDEASQRDAMFLENAGTPKYHLVPAGRNIPVKDCRIYGLRFCPYRTLLCDAPPKKPSVILQNNIKPIPHLPANISHYNQHYT